MALSRDEILTNGKPQIKEIDVPELNGTVFIRVMSGTERDAFELSCGDSLQNVRARLACMCLCDSDGNRLFDDTEVGEVGKLSGAALDVVFDAARRFNGLTETDVKELEGN